MANLTSAYKPDYEIDGFIELAADSLSCRQGALIGINPATGYAVNWSDTAGHVFVGMAVENYVDATRVKVTHGGKLLKGQEGDDVGVDIAGFASVNQVPDHVYCSSNNPNDITLTPGNVPIGRVVRFIAANKGWVKLFPFGVS